MSKTHAYDFLYFLPQEFLSDLPLRNGSFAAEVIQYFLSTNFPDVHHRNVDPGIFNNVYADSDFNSPSYRSRRDVCVRVPVGSQPRAAHMCEHHDAQAPRAEILAAKRGELGRFMLTAEFEFNVPGHLSIDSKTCVIFCWHDSVCDEDVTARGVLQVRSLVVVVGQEQGGVRLQPSTTVSWPVRPEVHGCHPDWLVKLFANVQSDLSEGVAEMVQNYVAQNLQSQLVLPQTMLLHPDLNLTYKLQDLQFVHSDQPSNQSFVIAHASCTIHARARNGSIQAFPDANMPWTGKHNTLPMDDGWRRAVGTGPAQLVLLGEARFSAELLTMLVRSMHYAGMLYSEKSSHVKDADLYSTIDMSCPEVDISKERAGVLMKQDHLHLQLDCLDKIAVNASNFSLLSATLSNVLEEILVSAYVPNDHTAGIVLQVLNASMESANVTAFHSQAFMGSGSDLKALVLQAIQKGLPLLNRQLQQTPITICGGGSSACALVPFVPHPAVASIPPSKMKAGYVRLSWHCQCGSSDFYESCVGFPCPEVQTRAVAMRQLREVKAKEAVLSSKQSYSKSSTRESTGTWVSIFSNRDCNFIAGQSIAFAQVRAEECTSSADPTLSPAFKLESHSHGWYLYSHCTAGCSHCDPPRWIPLRQCTCLSTPGSCMIVASMSDECAACQH